MLQARYRVQGFIGQGAMGRVFWGERLGLGRKVAIKLLRAPVGDPTFLQRFELEAQVMGRLAHPNCVSVIDVGIDREPFLVMDFVDGSTLRDLLSGGHFDPARAIGIVGQILAGLAHAHDNGIVHRDIKPENVIVATATGLAGEQVRLVDFGVAALVGRKIDPTAGMTVGSPSYMPPEQFSAAPLDVRADIYSVGILLYELLTGCKPFEGDSLPATLLAQKEMPPPPFEAKAPGLRLSSELEAVVRRALAKSPQERFGSAIEMKVALDEVPEMLPAFAAEDLSWVTLIEEPGDGEGSDGRHDDRRVDADVEEMLDATEIAVWAPAAEDMNGHVAGDVGDAWFHEEVPATSWRPDRWQWRRGIAKRVLPPLQRVRGRVVACGPTVMRAVGTLGVLVRGAAAGTRAMQRQLRPYGDIFLSFLRRQAAKLPGRMRCLAAFARSLETGRRTKAVFASASRSLRAGVVLGRCRAKDLLTRASATWRALPLHIRQAAGAATAGLIVAFLLVMTFRPTSEGPAGPAVERPIERPIDVTSGEAAAPSVDQAGLEAPPKGPLFASTTPIAADAGRGSSTSADLTDRQLWQRLHAELERRPHDARVPLALARHSLARQRYAESVAYFRRAMRVQPGLRQDREVIDDVIATLQSRRAASDAESLLHELGAPAQQQLRLAARGHEHPRVRQRARALVTSTGKRPFLRWL